MNLQGLITSLALLLLVFVIFVVKQGGFFKTVNSHFDGNQMVVTSLPGIEDITTDLVTGVAYLSSHDRRDISSTGNILVRQPGSLSILKAMILPEMDIAFRPHGISLLQLDDVSYLFVVNHEKPRSSSILRFTIKGDSLTAYKRFSHKLFISPNDVEAITPNEFYITNDHTSHKGLWRTFKDFTLSKDGNVVYFKEGKAAVVSQSISYANGIRVSRDKQYLFVAATTENKLYVYNHTTDLLPRKIVDSKELSTSPDNIEIDKFGYLWIACHPKLLKFIAHKKNEKTHSPSQVLKLVYLPNTDYKFLQEEVFLSDGSDISGSSAASYFHTDSTNTMLVGSVYEDKILVLERAL